MTTLFNVRVYGILINESKELLVTDEFHFGKCITKFPGGGLEFGEGPIDCLKREMLEETGSEVDVTGHFFTTDFFQLSAFNNQQQIISIYYRIKLTGSMNIRIKEKPFDFDEQLPGAQIFRWVPLTHISKNSFTFPIDQKVGEMIMLQRNIL